MRGDGVVSPLGALLEFGVWVASCDFGETRFLVQQVERRTTLPVRVVRSEIRRVEGLAGRGSCSYLHQPFSSSSSAHEMESKVLGTWK